MTTTKTREGVVTLYSFNAGQIEVHIEGEVITLDDLAAKAGLSLDEVCFMRSGFVLEAFDLIEVGQTIIFQQVHDNGR